jgi:uncharacterized protein YciI
MKHYILFYDVVPDHVERRVPFRDEHLELAWKAQERGEIVIAGALADEIGGAVLVFRGESPDVVQSFVVADPYVQNGLVTKVRICEWVTVVGDDAMTPLRP